MNPVILFRKNPEYREEIEIASEFFDVYHQRCAIPENSFVIGRYSCLPYFRELELDLEIRQSRLINNYLSHSWIANFDYYKEVEKFTPQTWFENDFPRTEYTGPFVVKGTTNSLKHRWSTHMFAQDRRAALQVASELANDSYIGSGQKIIYREYVPLKTYEKLISGLPVTKEFRLFFYKKELLTFGYYWDIAEKTDIALDKPGLDFARQIAEIVSSFVDFYVLDIAEKEDGGWVLIEINDAQQSGLSMCNPIDLYSNLAKCL